MSSGMYTLYEQETIISMNNAEKTANIYTMQRHIINKLLKIAKERPDEVKIISQTEDALEVVVPKRYIRITPPRLVSDEEREIARQRFAQYKQNLINKTEEADDESSVESENIAIDDLTPQTDSSLF